MASFQAKTGWDRLRMMEKEKKTFLSVPSQSGIQNSEKIAKKFKKLKKHQYGFF